MRKKPKLLVLGKLEILGMFMLLFWDACLYAHMTEILDIVYRLRKWSLIFYINLKKFFFFTFWVYLFIYLFIYLFMAVLGLRFCARAFSSCSKWGPLFIAVRRPLIIAASLVAEHRLQTRRLSNCGSRA